MSRTLAALCACLMTGFLSAAHAQTFKVLYNFQGGTDGATPMGPLIADAAGNLYGTTRFGGGHSCVRYKPIDCGTIFKLTPDGAETILYAFRVQAYPTSGVIADAKGNLYGSAPQFGYFKGCGGIFKLGPDGRASILYSFPKGGAGGSYPNGLIRGQAGNLYGTTEYGGSGGSGTVFKLVRYGSSRYGSLRVLHVFGGGNDGAYPQSSLLADSARNLFGTTLYGGGINNCNNGNLDCGTVFKLSPDGTETILYAFHGGADGSAPESSLIEDQAGDLYGTTVYGGNGKGAACSNAGCGTIFKLAPNGTETVLYTFQGGNDGLGPLGGLVMDGNGNLYGTAAGGGVNNAGTVFELTPSGSFTVLHAFARTDGANPAGGLLMNENGNLHGTTKYGGKGNCNTGCGVVFELTP